MADPPKEQRQTTTLVLVNYSGILHFLSFRSQCLHRLHLFWINCMIFLAILATHTQELLCCANVQKMDSIFVPYLVLNTSKEKKKGDLRQTLRYLVKHRQQGRCRFPLMVMVTMTAFSYLFTSTLHAQNLYVNCLTEFPLKIVFCYYVSLPYT